FGGAHGHANANLARALGDRNQHDVHDPDAADEQRHAGDGTEQDGHDAAGGVGDIGNVGDISHAEVVTLARADAVPGVEEIADLLLDAVGDFLGGGGDGDVLQPGLAAELFLQGGVGDVDVVVLVLAEAGLALGQQGADDGEGQVLDADGAADRIAAVREEVEIDGGAEDADVVGLGDVPVGEV